MRIETVSFLKQNASKLPLEEPLTITQNGEPVYIVESYVSWKERNEAIALVRLLSQSSSEYKEGKTISKGELLSQLKKRTLLKV